jgi:hypothetical protein
MLAHAARQCGHIVDDLRGAEDGGHHLEEALHRGRVEEVHPHDALRVGAGRRDRGDRQRGGVGRQHGALADDGVQLGKYRLLDVEALDRCLHHHITAGEVGDVGAEAGTAQQGRALIGVQPSPAHRPVGGALEVAAPAVGQLARPVDSDDLHATAGEHLGDARAHGPQTHHAHCLEHPCHGGQCASRPRV